MDQFIAKHADKLQGTLACFDRVLFRGYLPFFSGAALASFLDTRNIPRPRLKHFFLEQAQRFAPPSPRPVSLASSRTPVHSGESTLAPRRGAGTGPREPGHGGKANRKTWLAPPTFRLWRERGLTLVLVTHDIAIARRAQRVGVMSKGMLSVHPAVRQRAATGGRNN